jgi:hypothetical protein
MMTKPESVLEVERQASLDEARLLADAAALDRLSATDEWKVLDRLLGEHADRLMLALRQRGLGFAETDALRAELEAVEWLRYRPIALRRAVDEREKLAAHVATQQTRTEQAGR